MNDDGTEATDEMGVPVRESNARVVRWSDGRSVNVYLIHKFTSWFSFTNL